MNLLFIVQRYGTKIVGGAESACRMYAENLVQKGHKVSVVSSCATNYSDWSDEFTAGVETLNGVTVYRLPVVRPRSDKEFAPVHEHIQNAHRTPLSEQDRWSRQIGPDLKSYEEFLDQATSQYDAVICMSYLYWTTSLALHRLSGRVPILLHPTAHDEPMLRVPKFLTSFRVPNRHLYLTIEEKELVEKEFFLENRGSVVGLGVEAQDTATEEAVSRFCSRHELKKNKYLVFIGRPDPTKGYFQLIKFFEVFKERTGSDLELVLIGASQESAPNVFGVKSVGFLEEDDKNAAIRGALALVQPSFQESFSIVICEAWSQSTPVIVQNSCAVLRGQTIRSSGGLRFSSYPEFEECLKLLSENIGLRNQLGENGYDYVIGNYSWESVIDRYESELQLAISEFMSASKIS